MGGATAIGEAQGHIKNGLSPRGRGNLHVGIPRDDAVGSIPAWAGQPRPATGHPERERVYPRVGGATTGLRLYDVNPAGLSPRGRGNQGVQDTDRVPIGSIPAWAGQPIVYHGGCMCREVYPRVGGATAPAVPPSGLNQGLSPRGRGNHVQVDPEPLTAGSIPAWAGQPTHYSRKLIQNRVYPRVGGATPGVPSER